MGFLKYAVALAVLGVAVNFDEGVRKRTAHLGICGWHKVNTMALGMSPTESLHSISVTASDVASSYFKKELTTDMMHNYLTPTNVNEHVADSGYGVWSDPCEDSAYGCGPGRPAMLFLPSFEATADTYTGAVPMAARAVNGSLLVCRYGRQSALEAASLCYEEARKNSSTVYVAAASEGVGVALLLHKQLLTNKAPLPAGYWLLSPWLGAEGQECGSWLSPPCDVTKFPMELSKEEAEALPPTLVTYGASAAVAQWVSSLAGPKVSSDVYEGLPHNFFILSNWLAQNIDAARTAKSFFSEAL